MRRFPCPAEQPSKAKLALGDKGLHLAFLAQRYGLLVVAFGHLDLWRIGIVSDLSKEAERICLGAALSTLVSLLHSTCGNLKGILAPVSEEIGFAQMGGRARMQHPHAHGLVAGQSVFQQSQALWNTAR